jgi:short-subunit dehydrogenase
MEAASQTPARRPVVLVTGGSRGIGLALARGFAARGHDLVLVARDAGRLQQAAEAIGAEHSVLVAAIACDLGQTGGAASLLAAIEAAGSYVDILVNCAGVGVSGAFVTNDASEIHSALSLNVDAATSLMQACLPGMMARRRGGVLNVASLAGMLPMPYLALYGATKSYLVALSRAVASEVAGAGVTVSVLLPGPVDTAFFARGLHADAERTGLLPGLSPDTVASVAIDGFLARQRVITPGMLGSLARVGLKLLPRPALAALVRRVLAGAYADGGAAPPSGAQWERAAQRPTPARRGGLGQLLATHGHVLVLVCIALAFALQVGFGLRRTPAVDDDPGSYIGVAAGLLQHGVFARAFVPGREAPASGRYLAPGYPAVIAAVAILDTRLAHGIQCLMARQADCLRGNPFRALLVLQTLAGLAALALAYFLARALSGSSGIATLVTLLTFSMSHLPEFSGLVLPYAILAALVLSFCAALLCAHQRRSRVTAAVGGLLVGVLSLVEVYYAALCILAPLLLVCAERTRAKPSWRFAAGASAALVIAAGLVLAPWMARNYALFGDIALTDGVEARHFAERIAYNGVRGRELLEGLFCWLPGIGDLSVLFSPPETIRKFSVYLQGSLLREADRILTANPPVAGEGQFMRLLEVYVLGDPAGYARSSVLLLERGLRATGGLLVLWGWFALPVALRRLSAQKDLGPFLLVAGPLIGMAVVQGLLTANLAWMNLALVFVYAYAIVKVTGGLELPFAVRRFLCQRRRRSDPIVSVAGSRVDRSEV